MLKKAQVIALPYTEQEIISPLEIGRFIDVLTRHESIVTGFTWEYRKYMDGMIAQNPYHLYFVTDDEIKEGDWYIAIDIKSLIKCTKVTGYIHGGSTQSPKNLAKKVIATTNPDLHYKLSKIVGVHAEKDVAKIPTDFVEAYVREQGKIEEVNLEYEIEDRTKEWSTFNNPLINLISSLKLRSNCTVIVHPVKEKLYTRQEVVDLLITYSTVQVDIVAFIRDNLPII